MNIVVTQDLLLTLEQKKELESLGKVVYYDNTPTIEEWLERVQNADVIFSEEPGMHENVYNIFNTFLTFPFTDFLVDIDVKILRDHNLVTSAAKGGNKYAVAERIILGLLTLTRKITTIQSGVLQVSPSFLGDLGISGVYGMPVLILGKGNIGIQVGRVCTVLGMEVEYFLRGDDLREKCDGKKIIINCLSENKETIGLFNNSVIEEIQQPFYYMTIARDCIHDTDAIISHTKKGKIIGYADDCASCSTGDRNSPYFMKLTELLDGYNVFFTPHVARASLSGIIASNQVCIENIKAYLDGTPINLLY